MPEYIDFETVGIDELKNLRKAQVAVLKGQVQDYIEEGIVTYGSTCLRILAGGEEAGYACIGTYEYYKDIILEYYLTEKHRAHAGDILGRLAEGYGCRGWFVNSHDFFALPAMLDLKLPFEIKGYILSIGGAENAEYELAPGVTFGVAARTELQEIYDLIVRDGFYTGGGVETVEARIAEEELYSLRLDGRLIGVGFVSILKRTPEYPDTAVIIDPAERRKGWGTLLLKALIHRSALRNLAPTACCDAGNVISRRTLQGAGFFLDGCLLLARVENLL